MDLWNILGAIGGVAGGVGALLAWRKAAEANRLVARTLAQNDEPLRLATEANVIAQSASMYAREANAIARETRELEHEPQVRLSYSIAAGWYRDHAITWVDFRVSNYGRVPVSVVRASLAFRKYIRPISGLSGVEGFPASLHDVELPYDLLPGRSVFFREEAESLESEVVQRLEEDGEGSLVIEVWDEVGRRFA